MYTSHVAAFRAVAEYLDAASRTWIGWQLPPVQHALADAAWAPDARTAYCPRCGGSIGPGEVTAQGGCASCRNQSPIADCVIRLGAHRDALRQWVLAVKYNRWADMGEHLGQLLGEQVRRAGCVEMQRCIVVPMPMPWQRRLYRGIDHARVIASGVAAAMNVPLVRCLARSNGPPLVSRSASERKVLGGRGMHVAKRWGGWPVDGLDAVLVDDVRTSGATLRAADRLVKSLGIRRSIAAVVSVADGPGRVSIAVTNDGP